MRTVKSTWGLRILFKLAGIKLREVDGRFLIPDFQEVERRVILVCQRYNIRFAG